GQGEQAHRSLPRREGRDLITLYFGQHAADGRADPAPPARLAHVGDRADARPDRPPLRRRPLVAVGAMPLNAEVAENERRERGEVNPFLRVLWQSLPPPRPPR